MKRFLSILISFLFCINCIAQEICIQLSKDSLKDLSIDKRSISVGPRVTHDGNTFYIYSDMVIKDVRVRVIDVQNNITHSTILTNYSTFYRFELSDLRKGEYTLELGIEDDTFYGKFDLL